MVASVPELANRHSGWPNRRGQFTGNHHRVLGRLGEVRAPGDLAGHRRDDRRVCVPGQAHAVAAVQVHVLVAVDVIDLGAAAVAEPDRLRRGDLPAWR